MWILTATLKRAAQLIVLFLLVTAATFILSSLIPGDFFTTHQVDPSIRAETVTQLRQRYGLDQPFYVQYAHWLKGLVHLDLGPSLFYGTPVSTVVADALSRTLWIGIPALVLAFGGGILLGTLHGICRNRWPGYVLDFLSTTALSLPSLVLGLSALLLASRTNWFPLGSMSSSQLQAPGFWPWLADRIHHLVLPVMCLTLPLLAYIERIQRAATQSTWSELYVRSARSRGLGRGRIFVHYLLRPALNPILSTSGPIFGAILSGSLVLEVIFAWPGLGQVTYDALFNRDLFLLVGSVVGSSVLLIVGNLAADLLLVALDPRTRSAGSGVTP